jgi:hypothetical protein
VALALRGARRMENAVEPVTDPLERSQLRAQAVQVLLQAAWITVGIGAICISLIVWLSILTFKE